MVFRCVSKTAILNIVNAKFIISYTYDNFNGLFCNIKKEILKEKKSLLQCPSEKIDILKCI